MKLPPIEQEIQYEFELEREAKFTEFYQHLREQKANTADSTTMINIFRDWY